MRGHLGEARIWRGEPLQIPEDRIVRTLIGQTSLALERARLVQVEMRAHVLEESDRLKSALLSSVRHELRTPLVTIKAAATGLLSGVVDWNSPARRELLIALEDEADRLNQLVDNLLSSSRLEAGALKLERQWHLPLEIIYAAVDRLARVLQGHVVEVAVSEDLPLVSVDHVLMQQVFANLLGNCAKYAPAGTIIHIEASVLEDRNLWIWISNEGPPVPEEHLATIFEPFQRLETIDRPGIGLGLSICKGITEAHGGQIWATNLPKGFAYHLTLPLTPEGEDPPLILAEADAS
jgi:two-component system sensor histidine kinase KdpD